ncbi:MAG: hypothetical protein KAX49_08470 [Halanaerobiales bacterium]|nr:hypothetical protein [Halanaerobiales bacterium]
MDKKKVVFIVILVVFSLLTFLYCDQTCYATGDSGGSSGDSSGGKGGGSGSTPDTGTANTGMPNMVIKFLAVEDYIENPLNCYEVPELKELFEQKGWYVGEEKYNYDVVPSDFIENDSWADILVYSGHGSTFLIKLLDGQYVSDEDLGKMAYGEDKENFKWVIFSCCDFVCWGNDLESIFTTDSKSVHSILGYENKFREHSFTTKELYKEFCQFLFGENGEKSTILKAWEDANKQFDIYKDRFTYYYIKYAESDTIDAYVELDPLQSDFTVYYVDCENSYDQGTPSSTSSFSDIIINKSLNDSVLLNYTKPQQTNIYTVTCTSEISDYQTVEKDFYDSFGPLIPELYQVQKIDYGNYIQYKNDYASLQYYKSTGGLIYRRNKSSEFFIEPASNSEPKDDEIIIITDPNPDPRIFSIPEPSIESFVDDIIPQSELDSEMQNIVNIAVDFVDTYGGGMPSEAVLDNIYAIRHTNTQTGVTKIKSYLIEYRRYINNIKIAGDNTDGIMVEVDADGVCYYKRLWRNYNNNMLINNLVDEEYALQLNTSNICNIIFGSPVDPIRITGVNLVYKGSTIDATSNTLIPAWEYKIENSPSIFVNALNGQIIDY